MAGREPRTAAANLNHFASYAAERLPYPIEGFTNEVNRLLGVLGRRLRDRIADIAPLDDQARKVLFGQTAASVTKAETEGSG